MVKNICILGSTGSVGTQALDVARTIEDIHIKVLCANTNINLLYEQIQEFKPEAVCVVDEEKCYELSKRLTGSGIHILCGADGLAAAACYNGVDTVLNSVVGSIGLLPTLAAIDAGKDIALANKETLVCAGELVMEKVRKNNVKLLPVDSEHSAIFQCLQGNTNNKIDKLYLTASGGPFRTLSRDALEKVTVQDALKHPNWNMGAKITIDSASLMNKGLEVIEAKWLFDVALEQIQVLVHPQSIIHSMVEYKDGSVMAQLGEADMRLPIAYAFTYPHRETLGFNKLDFTRRNSLTFEQPRYDDFPCLNLAIKAMKIGGTMPAVLNAANEAAVNRFITGKISFTSIPVIIESAMDAYTVKYNYDCNDVLEADSFARSYVNEVK